MNMQLHENSVRLWNASKVFVYKYINIKQQRFVKFLLFLHFTATGKFKLLGILVLSRWQSICIQASHIQNPVRFRRLILTLFKLPDPGASIYVQNLLKFPTWGGQGRSKSPPRPVVPPPPPPSRA